MSNLIFFLFVYFKIDLNTTKNVSFVFEMLTGTEL